MVEVAFPLPVRQQFTYAVPPDWPGGLAAGDRVIAPLSGRESVGVVVDIRCPDGPTRSLKDLLRPASVDWSIPADVLELGRWVSEYYLSSLGEALAVASGPVGKGGHLSYRLRRPDWDDSQKNRRISRRERDILEALSSGRPVGLDRIRQRLSLPAKGARDSTAHLCEIGLVETSWVAAPPPIPSGAVFYGVAPRSDVEIPAELRDYLIESIGSNRTVSLDELADQAPGGRKTIHSLLLQNALIWDPTAAANPPDTTPVIPEPAFDDFDAEQKTAAGSIGDLLSRREYATALLWGATGSGKTAVYCDAIRRAWSLGKRAILLVPEIGLAGQIIRRLRATLNEPIALWHSALTPAQRFWVSRLVARGHYRLVVGARSAVFAPLPDLGLIIVDEEHADAYKQTDPPPRYHARDVAIVRARLNKAVCLLGSATPSCESYHNAASGKHHLLRLTRRVRSRALPIVRLVDLRRRKREPEDTWIMPDLSAAILDTLRSGRKVIVFINRRGHSSMVACTSCGHAERCPDCGLTLTYHSIDRTFRCHFCARTRPALNACPACGGTDFLFHGVGTQKVETALAALDPIVRLARLDSDIASHPAQAAAILDGFAGDRFNLLVGTQMVAKGLDIADVGLVGVIWADQQMAFPDFRAEEKTFQLLTQVAGRAGRGEQTSGLGQVLVQTFHPDHELIELAAGQNAELFFERELPRRQKLYYPPYSHLILISFSSPDRVAAHVAASEFAAFWRAESAKSKRPPGRLLGPSPAAIPRRIDRYIMHLAVKTNSVHACNALIDRYQREHAPALRRKKIALAVDVDPNDFL